VIYTFFIVVYLLFVHSNLENIYSHHLALHRLLSYLVLPWPWLIFVALQFYDPGEITRENVKSYINLYPLDRVLYFPKVCPTLKLPVVARSRFCRYTGRRIALVLSLTPESMTTTVPGSSRRSAPGRTDSSSSSSSPTTSPQVTTRSEHCGTSCGAPRCCQSDGPAGSGRISGSECSSESSSTRSSWAQ
jgi:hypothetical protein